MIEAETEKPHYADRPPAGFRLIDRRQPSEIGDMAFAQRHQGKWLGGEWIAVKRGEGINGRTTHDLWGHVLAIARKDHP